MIKRFLFLLITIIPIYCYAGTKWGEILFKQDEPISGFCYESITRKKIKLSNITIQNILNGGDVICSE